MTNGNIKLNPEETLETFAYFAPDAPFLAIQYILNQISFQRPDLNDCCDEVSAQFNLAFDKH